MLAQPFQVAIRFHRSHPPLKTLSDSFDTLTDSFDTLTDSFDTLTDSFDTLIVTSNTNGPLFLGFQLWLFKVLLKITDTALLIVV